MRFTKVNAVSFHHKAAHVTTITTRAQTVPQLFPLVDHQSRFVVFMEYAKPDELLPALHESDAAAANERYQLVRPLHPLNLCLVESAFKKLSVSVVSQKAVKTLGEKSLA